MFQVCRLKFQYLYISQYKLSKLIPHSFIVTLIDNLMKAYLLHFVCLSFEQIIDYLMFACLSIHHYFVCLIFCHFSWFSYFLRNAPFRSWGIKSYCCPHLCVKICSFMELFQVKWDFVCSFSMSCTMFKTSILVVHQLPFSSTGMSVLLFGVQ